MTDAEYERVVAAWVAEVAATTKTPKELLLGGSLGRVGDHEAQKASNLRALSEGPLDRSAGIE
jgi:hypothetical protein